MISVFLVLLLVGVYCGPRDRKPTDKPEDGLSGFVVGSGNDKAFLHDQQSYIADSKKVVVFVHGSGQHLSNYYHVRDAFLENGVNFHSYDARYHGKSTGGDRCFDLKDFDVMANDLNVLLSTRIPDSIEEIYIIGHSMGTITILLTDVLHDLKKNNPKVKGFILAGNAAEVSIDWITIQTAKLLSRFFPRMIVVENSLDKITNNPKMIQMMENDPILDVYEHSTRFGMVFLDAVDRVTEGLEEITMPMMIMHGTSDLITPISAVDYIYTRVGSKEKKVVLYGGMMHELFMDVSYKKVVKDVCSWIDSLSKCKQ